MVTLGMPFLFRTLFRAVRTEASCLVFLLAIGVLSTFMAICLFFSTWYPRKTWEDSPSAIFSWNIIILILYDQVRNRLTLHPLQFRRRCSRSIRTESKQYLLGSRKSPCRPVAIMFYSWPVHHWTYSLCLWSATSFPSTVWALDVIALWLLRWWLQWGAVGR